MAKSLIKKLGLKRFNAMRLAIVSLIILSFSTGCTQQVMKDTNMNIKESTPDLLEPKQDDERDTIKVGNDGLNAGIANDETLSEPVTPEAVGYEGEMISYYLKDIGRNDPFMPQAESVLLSSGTVFLAPPPETITEDSDAVTVIKTKVSGIMYDETRPSAIINVNEADHLVRIGDTINSYKVLSIDQNHVTVELGANIYKAGVGELFSDDGINFNNVSNLEAKFGSSLNKPKEEL